MAGLSRKGKSRPKPAMNVTPLVDVVLVLLIIFMVVIPAMEQGLPIDSPTVVNVDEDEPQDPFLLSVDAEGHLYFDNEPLDDDRLRARLDRARSAEASRKLVIRADRETRYADVRRLMAIAQDVGFPGIRLRVSRRDDNES